MKKLSLLLVTFALAACAETTTVIFNSEPQGALLTLVESEWELGRTPYIRHYPANDHRAGDTQGCFMLEGVRAEWTSGATVRIDLLRFCDGPGGEYFVDLARPEDHPDLNDDLRFAAQLIERREGAFVPFSESWDQSTRGASAIENPYPNGRID